MFSYQSVRHILHYRNPLKQNADLTFKCWSNLQQLAFVIAPNFLTLCTFQRN